MLRIWIIVVYSVWTLRKKSDGFLKLSFIINCLVIFFFDLIKLISYFFHDIKKSVVYCQGSSKMIDVCFVDFMPLSFFLFYFILLFSVVSKKKDSCNCRLNPYVLLCSEYWSVCILWWTYLWLLSHRIRYRFFFVFCFVFILYVIFFSVSVFRPLSFHCLFFVGDNL